MLDEYLKQDWVLSICEELEDEGDNSFRTHRWLKEMDNKRMIYSYLYGDLLRSKNNLRVLDVGGGYTSITKKLVHNCDYMLLDFMAHGEHERLRSIENRLNVHFWRGEDWYNFDISAGAGYDIIITNDLFPDVDQRLELFLDRYLPFCHELRILVTYYNTPQFYTTHRVDDTEILTFLSWDGNITGMKLKKYLNRLQDTTVCQLDEMAADFSSIYRNGRQVAMMTLQGDI
jgi:hypothetical protein